MARPYRNPATVGEVEINYQWARALRTVHPNDRPEGWDLNASYREDHDDYFDEPHREVDWPERRLRERDIEPNTRMFRDYKELDIEKLPEGPYIPRDIILPPFRVEYDTHEQINQKLNSTIILVKNFPCLVVQTGVRKNKFFLHIRGKGFDGLIAYDDIKDCRGIAPGYFSYQGTAYWLFRVPERQNSQGMCQRNMWYRQAGYSGQAFRCSTGFLQEALAFTKDIPYSNNLPDILMAGGGQSVRLNNRVALYLTGKKDAPVGVEYCGRPLGLMIHDRCKVLDENDLGPTWIMNDLAKVNLELMV